MAARSPAAATEKHPLDQVLPFGQMFIYGLQHVLSMYAGVVAVPLIVGTAFRLSGPEITYLVSAGLFISGLATLLQTIGVWKFGARQPIVQGTSFAAVSTILAVGLAEGGVAGLRAVFGALLVAGLLALLIAPVFTRLLRFFPEVVTGVVITVIGISLLPVAMRWAGGGVPTAPTFGAPRNIAVAAITMAIIVLIYRFLPGFFGRVAILLGLVLGTVVARPAPPRSGRVFNILGRKREAEGPIFAEGPAPAAISHEDEARVEGYEPLDHGQARRADDGSTLSEIDLPSEQHRHPGTPKS